MIPTFPPEIIDRVIELTQSPRDRDTLHCAALVHSSWLPKATALLFSRIKLSEDNSDKLQELLKSPVFAARIDGLIRTLSVHNPDDDGELWGDPSSRRKTTGIAKMLWCRISTDRGSARPCPFIHIFRSVHSLHINSDEDAPIHRHTVELCRQLGSKVTALELRDNLSRDFSAMDILSHFPNMQHLFIDGSWKERGVAANLTNVPHSLIPHSLQALRLSWDTASTVKWLSCMPTRPSITTLQMDNLFPEEVPRSATSARLVEHFATGSLLHLRLEFAKDGTPNISLLIGLETLTTLRTLELFGLTCTKQCLGPLIETLTTLSPTIQQFTFKICWPDRADLMLNFNDEIWQRFNSVLATFGSLRSVEIILAVPPMGEQSKAEIIHTFHGLFANADKRKVLHVSCVGKWKPSQRDVPLHPRFDVAGSSEP